MDHTPETLMKIEVAEARQNLRDANIIRRQYDGGTTVNAAFARSHCGYTGGRDELSCDALVAWAERELTRVLKRHGLED